ncbi:lysozyme inhibitor LprI family protein [Flavobacterium ajazii]|uniref:lysozyme inhibitor LprI family protein n=1 Tax=Flavobacterium ajazii TaxID=2692318 RepID=UPI0013D814B6|nr:lysozyme inhibitor LprI family protein [Flavobacterium ajazii]
MKKIFFVLFLFFCFTEISFSQKAVDATGETELYLAYEKTDKELNLVYNKLKAKLGKKDQANLIASQKDWIKFRDSNCKFKSYPEGEGGVIANKMHTDCLMQTTINRTKELKSLMNGF